MILKKIAVLIFAALILSVLTASAYSKNDDGPAVNRGKVLASIHFGKNSGEISLPEAKSDSAFIPNPSCFTSDSSENIFITDVVAGKVLKVSAGERKAADLFSYKKSPIGMDFISDIAVSDSGFVYLADAESNKCFKFSQDGRAFGTLCEKGRERTAKKLHNIFTGDSSSVLIVDSLDHKILVFNDDGGFSGEVKLPISEMIFSYENAADAAGNLYISSLEENVFKIMRADRTSEIIFKHSCDPRELGARIVDCNLIGFDVKENAYVKVAVIGEGKTAISHYLVKFEKGLKDVKKMKIPAPAKGAGRAMADPYIILRENSVLTYVSDAGEFKIIEFEF